MDKDCSFKEMAKEMKFLMENVKNGRNAALQGSLQTKLMSRFALPCPDFPTFSSATVVDKRVQRQSHLYQRVL